MLFADCFPLVPSLSARGRGDAIAQQIHSLQTALRDPVPAVRRAAARAAAENVIAKSWELLPTADAMNLVATICDLCFDKTYFVFMYHRF